MKKTLSKRWEAREKGRRKRWLQKAARKKLGLHGGNLRGLFEVVAKALGGTWDGRNKAHGYDLLAHFVGTEYQPETPKPRIKKATPAKSDDVNAPEFLSSYAWRSLRMRVLTARGARCECCGASPKDGIVINVDHIKPRRKYPELALEASNLQILCDVCNHGKGNWDETDWRVSTETVTSVVDYAPVWWKH